MHHVRHLKDINPNLSSIHAIMAKLHLLGQRKQIPLCSNCHTKIHLGQYSGRRTKNYSLFEEKIRNGEPYALKGARTVREKTSWLT